MRRTRFNTRAANSERTATLVELHALAPVWAVLRGTRCNDLERQLGAVDADYDEVVRIVLDAGSRPHEVFDPHLGRGVLAKVQLQVGLAFVRVGRRAPAAAH